jgi:hypothetical protein
MPKTQTFVNRLKLTSAMDLFSEILKFIKVKIADHQVISLNEISPYEVLEKLFNIYLDNESQDQGWVTQHMDDKIIIYQSANQELYSREYLICKIEFGEHQEHYEINARCIENEDFNIILSVLNFEADEMELVFRPTLLHDTYKFKLILEYEDGEDDNENQTFFDDFDVIDV